MTPPEKRFPTPSEPKQPPNLVDERGDDLAQGCQVGGIEQHPPVAILVAVGINGCCTTVHCSDSLQIGQSNFCFTLQQLI